MSTVRETLFATPLKDAVKVVLLSSSTVALSPSMLTTLSSLEAQLTSFAVLTVKSDLTVLAVSVSARKIGEAERRAASVSSIL